MQTRVCWGVIAVLKQPQENGVEQQVAYFSRKLNMEHKKSNVTVLFDDNTSPTMLTKYISKKKIHSLQ